MNDSVCCLYVKWAAKGCRKSYLVALAKNGAVKRLAMLLTATQLSTAEEKNAGPIEVHLDPHCRLKYLVVLETGPAACLKIRETINYYDYWMIGNKEGVWEYFLKLSSISPSY